MSKITVRAQSILFTILLLASSLLMLSSTVKADEEQPRMVAVQWPAGFKSSAATPTPSDPACEATSDPVFITKVESVKIQSDGEVLAKVFVPREFAMFHAPLAVYVAFPLSEPSASAWQQLLLGGLRSWDQKCISIPAVVRCQERHPSPETTNIYYRSPTALEIRSCFAD